MFEPALKNAVVRIDVIGTGGRSRGTGFLVTDQLVLTALHVVADRGQTASTGSLQLLPGVRTLTFASGTAQAHVVPASVVEGAWDAIEDWIVLRLDAALGITPPRLGRIDSSEEWWGFGYPAMAANDGMVVSGRIKDTAARYYGTTAYQLFSEEAAAGDAAPMPGFSGGPCSVDGVVVGHMRSALMASNASVAGTLFACPLDVVHARVEALLGEGSLPPLIDITRPQAADVRRPIGKDRKQQLVFLHKVREAWITGVLERSLAGGFAFELPLRPCPEAARTHPFGDVADVSESGPEALPKGTRLVDVLGPGTRKPTGAWTSRRR